MAVVDAAFAEAGEITDQLIPITKDNDKLVWNEDKSKLLGDLEGARFVRTFFKAL